MEKMEKEMNAVEKLEMDRMLENVERWNQEAVKKFNDKEEAGQNEINYVDVSKNLNITNSKLGHVLPAYSDSDVLVHYGKIDYSNFNEYNKAMSKLNAQFDTLVKNADMYKEEYLNQELAKIREEAQRHETLALMEIENQYKQIIENPKVVEKVQYSGDKTANAVNRATALQITQAVLATDDVEMIHNLLLDNISNSDVRLLAKIKMNSLMKSITDGADRNKLGQMITALNEYENNLKAKSEVGILEEKFNATKGAFDRVAGSKEKFVAQVADLNNWSDEVKNVYKTYDFSLFNLKKQAKK